MLFCDAPERMYDLTPAWVANCSMWGGSSCGVQCARGSKRKLTPAPAPHVDPLPVADETYDVERRNPNFCACLLCEVVDGGCTHPPTRTIAGRRVCDNCVPRDPLMSDDTVRLTSRCECYCYACILSAADAMRAHRQASDAIGRAYDICRQAGGKPTLRMGY
jgi:hypothetical protein